jgi:hypothetical protein
MHPLQVWVKLHQLVGLPDDRSRLSRESSPTWTFPPPSSCHYHKPTTILTAFEQSGSLCGSAIWKPALCSPSTQTVLRSREVCRLCPLPFPLHWIPADQTIRELVPPQRCPNLCSNRWKVHIVKRHRFAAIRSAVRETSGPPRVEQTGEPPLHPPQPTTTPFCGKPKGG